MKSTIITPQERPEPYTDQQLQSLTIDLLRFPLAIMVIFIHMNPVTVDLVSAEFPLLSGRGIFNIIAIACSHTISSIAVPTFFLISGYLFFINIKAEWSWDVYKKKMQRRLHSLIIPYFLWNTLAFLLAIALAVAIDVRHGYSLENVADLVTKNSWHVFYDCKVWGTTKINWLGEYLRSTGPYDLPLWFLRDLIVVSILSPVIYFFIKHLKVWYLALLFLPCISRIWPLIPGLSINALFYFSLGAYLAINRRNIVQIVTRHKWWILPPYAILLVLAIVFDGANTHIGHNILPFMVLSGVFTAFYVASQIIVRYNIKPNKFLVSSCFFVYALHTIGEHFQPIALSQRILHIIIPGATKIEGGICYLLAPFLTAALCVAVYAICRKLFPKLTLIFSGNK